MHLLANGPPQSVIVIALMLTVIAAAWTDHKEWRIPNALLAPSAAAALMLSTFAPGGQGLVHALLGALAGLLVFMPLYLLKGMGAGDIKLMTVIGLYAGPNLTLDIALVTALIGGVWVIALFNQDMSADRYKTTLGFLLRNKLKLQSKESKKNDQQNKSLMIPYGLVIAAGTMIALCIASSQ
jgi:prepilin peptidase CpaA